MDWTSLLANTLGIAIYHAVVGPGIQRYQTWKAGPRIQVARRNWRGVYVLDLGIKRAERALWLAFASFVVFGIAVTWTALTMPL